MIVESRVRVAITAKGLGSEDLSQVAHAAVAGRVATLPIEVECEVAGRIDGSTGNIDPEENPMKIQLNTDVHIDGTEALAAHVRDGTHPALIATNTIAPRANAR